MKKTAAAYIIYCDNGWNRYYADKHRPESEASCEGGMQNSLGENTCGKVFQGLSVQ